MANFNTHLSVAAVGSGMLATLCLQIGFVDAKDAILLASMGVLGGILPDVDLHYSHPSRILFSMLGIVAAFLWIFSVENHFSILQLWGAGFGIYLFVRYPFWAFFQKITVHRGSIHSIAAALLFALIVTSLAFHVFGKASFVSWLTGTFIFLGFILHLLLDEIYSVDFMGHRLKRSFGTALKLIDSKEHISSAVIIIGIFVTWFLTPDINQFLDTLSSPETYRVILERL